MGLFSGTHLEPGTSAPDFTLSNQHGKSVSLAAEIEILLALGVMP